MLCKKLFIPSFIFFGHLFFYLFGPLVFIYSVVWFWSNGPTSTIPLYNIRILFKMTSGQKSFKKKVFNVRISGVWYSDPRCNRKMGLPNTNQYLLCTISQGIQRFPDRMTVLFSKPRNLFSDQDPCTSLVQPRHPNSNSKNCRRKDPLILHPKVHLKLKLRIQWGYEFKNAQIYGQSPIFILLT